MIADLVIFENQNPYHWIVHYVFFYTLHLYNSNAFSSIYRQSEDLSSVTPPFSISRTRIAGFSLSLQILRSRRSWPLELSHRGLRPSCTPFDHLINKFFCGTSSPISIQVPAACKFNRGSYPDQKFHFVLSIHFYTLCSMPLHTDAYEYCALESTVIYTWCSFSRPFSNLCSVQSCFRPLLTGIMRMNSCQHLALFFMFALLSHFDRGSTHASFPRTDKCAYYYYKPTSLWYGPRNLITVYRLYANHV